MIELDDAFLRGSYPPLVTPFRDGAVDEQQYASLVDFHVREGSHGVTVCGTTGEPSLLSLHERKRSAEIAIATADGRLPVMVATGAPSHADTVELSEHAVHAGADALLVVTPAFSKPPPRGLVAFYADICARTDLPVLLYHIPGRAAVGVDIGTLEQIAEQAPNFVGMKHAVADMSLVSEALVRLGPDFRIFVGLEELSFPMLAIGAAGMVNAVGNLLPRRVAQLYEAVRDGKLDDARAIHFELWALNQSIFFETNPIPLKYMMKRLGIIDTNEHRLPMLPASAETERRCDVVLDRAGLS